ncbi:MAG: precorrin-6A/cobalt-precorrin-6A reductase, partial [Lachnospiraceae bacterium]|nr:precorrin-6A/cobalt-precorrin-6A reductase [Lachnospiraceae bacterium]
NILEACSQTHTEYVRLLREDTFEDNNNSQVITVPDVKHAARYLKDNSEGKIFISTGSKELHEYKVIPDYKERIVARVLPVEDSIRKCEELGLKHTIYEKGPFDYEQNKAAFSKENAEWLVTKSAGKAGGFDEKFYAALELGMKVIVITRPEERTDGKTLEEVNLQISKMLRE